MGYPEHPLSPSLDDSQTSRDGKGGQSTATCTSHSADRQPIGNSAGEQPCREKITTERGSWWDLGLQHSWQGARRTVGLQNLTSAALGVSHKALQTGVTKLQ